MTKVYEVRRFGRNSFSFALVDGGLEVVSVRGKRAARRLVAALDRAGVRDGRGIDAVARGLDLLGLRTYSHWSVDALDDALDGRR